MAPSVTRLAGAIEAVRQACAAASSIPVHSIGSDDDLLLDLNLDELERESLSLILEEVFGEGVTIPEEFWDSALYRTPAALAEWCIRKAEEVAWAETMRQRRRA